jgi:hypothetical protein
MRRRNAACRIDKAAFLNSQNQHFLEKRQTAADLDFSTFTSSCFRRLVAISA